MADRLTGREHDRGVIHVLPGYLSAVGRGAAVTAVVALTLALVTACGASTSAHLSFGPASALWDTALTATVDGAHGGASVRLTLSTEDRAGVSWTSSATFTADPRGTVTLDSPATGGAYTGVDPSGLVDALYPTSGVVPVDFTPPSPWHLTMTARTSGSDARSVTVTRLAPTDVGVTDTTLTVATDGLAGVLAEPADTSRKGPAAVVWGGSEGGLSTQILADTLAAHGHPALALAYFREPGLPNDLVDIPMEYFAKAVTYLDGRPGVDPTRVVVAGESRGSEAALLLAVERPDLVHAVMGLSPSSVVNPGTPDTSAAAWTYRGAAIPHVPVSEFGQADPPQTGADIPVERIAAPVLLECGEQDREWPSCGYVEAMTARFAARPPTVIRDADAGHHICVPVPGVPAPDLADPGAVIADGGGTAVANGHARTVAWPKLLAFVAATP